MNTRTECPSRSTAATLVPSRAKLTSRHWLAARRVELVYPYRRGAGCTAQQRHEVDDGDVVSTRACGTRGRRDRREVRTRAAGRRLLLFPGRMSISPIPPRVLSYPAILVRRATRHKAPTARTTAQPCLPHPRRPCSRAPKRSYTPLRSHGTDTALRSFQRHAAQEFHPAEHALAHLERRMPYVCLGHVCDLAEAPQTATTRDLEGVPDGAEPTEDVDRRFAALVLLATARARALPAAVGKIPVMARRTREDGGIARRRDVGPRAARRVRPFRLRSWCCC